MGAEGLIDMTETEVEQFLQQHNRKPVKATLHSGETILLLRISVDQEGCSSYAIGDSYDPSVMNWWQFDEFAHVEEAQPEKI